MKLFLLSDLENLNDELKFKEEVSKHSNKIAYISSSPQGEERPWFNNCAKELKKINLEIELTYFDLSRKFTDEKLQDLLNFEILLLSGGNTFEFLQSIKNRNFDKIIEKFKKKLIIGTSAGAIILTPSVKIASFEDENTIGMIDF